MCKSRLVKGFTLLELMVVVVIISILAAVAIPAFVNYLKRSKTSEAVENTRMIVEGAVAYWDSDHSAPDGTSVTHCVPLTKGPSPDGDPGPGSAPVNDAPFIAHFNEHDGTWQALAWKPVKPFLYRYTWERILVECPVPAQGSETAAGTVSAIGDLDGDDTNSNFERDVNVIGGEMTIGNLTMTDTLE